MWTDPSERPACLPKGLPDIYVTDSLNEVAEKLKTIPTTEEETGAESSEITPQKQDGSNG